MFQKCFVGCGLHPVICMLHVCPACMPICRCVSGGQSSTHSPLKWWVCRGVPSDNSAIFRDLKRIGSRKVLSTAPGLKVLEVEQLGELKVRRQATRSLFCVKTADTTNLQLMERSSAKMQRLNLCPAGI